MSLKKELTYGEVLSKAAAYCAKAEHSEREMLEKLHSWGVSERMASQVMTYLVNEKYIDNVRFAEAYVSDKFKFNCWGKQKIKMMLMSKGVDIGVISSVLDSIDDDEYQSALTALLMSKFRTLGDVDIYMLRKKLTAFAIQRGFEYNVTAVVVADILKSLE